MVSHLASFLLAACSSILLLLARDNLAKHDNTVAVHECYSGQTLAILERVANQRLLWLESALGHLVRFQRVRIFHFLSSSLLAHLPDDFRDTASRPSASHETDRRIAALDLIRDIEHLD